MNILCRRSLTIFFTVAVYLQSSAQEIKNDTIYTSVTQQTSLYFPSAVTFCDYTETNAYTRFTKKIENDMVILYAKVKNPQPAVLKVSEGRRNHVFIIAYKEELSANELGHDWSDVKRLKVYLALRENKDYGTSQIFTATQKTESLPVVVSPPIVVNAPVTSLQDSAKISHDTVKGNYDNILLEAYSFLEAKNYPEARKLYAKASSLKPDELIAKNNIKEIDKIVDSIAGRELAAKEKLQSDASYKSQISLANTAFNSNNYEDAKAGYSSALTFKPNDTYAKKQLDASQKKLDEMAKTKAKGKERLEANYTTAIELGQAAMKQSHYEDARASFSMALSFKPNDPYAKNQFDASQKKLDEIVKNKEKDEVETKYTAAIDSAKAALKQLNYEEAKAGFTLALSLKPNDSYAKKQLEAFQNKLTENVRTKEEEELEAKYNRAIESAQAALKQSNYEEAKAGFTLALGFKPNDTYAKKQLEAFQNKLTENVRTKEEEELEAKYNRAIESAQAALKQSNYEEAKAGFTLALSLKPNDTYAKNQVSASQNKLDEFVRNKEKEEIESKYNAAIEKANAAIQQSNYEEAKAGYLLALSFKPNDTYAKKQLDASQNKSDEILRNREKEELETKYTAAIESAKAALKKSNYDEAKDAFAEASKLKPFEAYPKLQISEIDKKVKESLQKAERDRILKERETAFNNALANGNDSYNLGNYSAAKTEYKKALAIKADTYSTEQLKKIDKIIADSTQRAIDEKRNTANYNSNIQKADKAFDIKDYANAKRAYNQALAFKDDQYAKGRIAEINNILIKMAEDIELTKKYNTAIDKGKIALAGNDYEGARTFFEEASATRPSDQFARDQLAITSKTIDDIAKEKERNEKYDSALVKAAFALQTQAYNSALTNYREAAAWKPLDAYPAKMITYVEGIIAALAEQAFRDSVSQKRALERKQFAILSGKATQAISDKRWQEALENYKEILTLNPLKSEEEFANKKIQAITLKLEEIARIPAPKEAPVVIAPKSKREVKEQNRLKEISRILAEENKKVQATPQLSPALLSQWAIGSPPNEQPAYKSISTTLQTEAIPYSHDELIKKYPTVNFDELPPGQTSDVSDRKNRSQNFQVSNKVLQELPRLNYADSTNSVKITCQGISFSGANAYVKLLIKNLSSTNDFLTGSLQLKLVKQGSAPQELHQRFVSDFPVVLPKKEFAIVYVADGSLTVDPGDNFILEMNDRMKTVQLKINIPGSIYNQQKTAKL